MNEQATDIVVTEEADLVSITLIAAEIGESVDVTALYFGEAVIVDDIGMRAVPAEVARRFFTERAESKERYEEATRRRREERPTVRKPAGVPAVEGQTPMETIMEAETAAGVYVSPHEEFGGWERPNFLEQELAAGREVAAEKRRRVEQMKKDLS